MKAKQMQAQFDAQNKRTVKQHSSRRRMLAALAAAAALMICGTVTVGAVNDWNYAAVFSKYFTEKSGEQVLYDFSGMGLDIGEVIEGDGFTLTIQSVAADTAAVYIAYDIALSDEIRAEIAPYGDAQISGCVHGGISKQGETGTYTPNIHGLSGVPDADGIYHFVTVAEMDAGTDLSDKQIEIETGEQLVIGYNYNDESYDPEPMILSVPNRRLTYDLADITVQKGITVFYGGTLPNDANENIFEEMTVTPFMLRFRHDETVGKCGGAPKCGWLPGVDEVEVSYTAVYEDGTELQIPYDPYGSGGCASLASANGSGGYDAFLEVSRYFSAPISLDGLTAIRINDIEIPVQ
ncbi:MAG: DUF4179 domain-containing protein [Oscillospiraceae bacterium]|nr:DUF4179 domain-containing protein [Oscillospiraceae bacterium]